MPEIKTLCLCCSGKTYQECCEPLLTGAKAAETPEQLMRSRYTAYSQANIDYIQRTMKAPANLNYDANEAKAWAESTQWLRLDVIKSQMNGDSGHVRFRAHFSTDGRKQEIYEDSEFRRDQGQWYYVSGVRPKK